MREKGKLILVSVAFVCFSLFFFSSNGPDNLEEALDKVPAPEILREHTKEFNEPQVIQVSYRIIFISLYTFYWLHHLPRFVMIGAPHKLTIIMIRTDRMISLVPMLNAHDGSRGLYCKRGCSIVLSVKSQMGPLTGEMREETTSCSRVPTQSREQRSRPFQDLLRPSR